MEVRWRGGGAVYNIHQRFPDKRNVVIEGDAGAGMCERKFFGNAQYSWGSISLVYVKTMISTIVSPDVQIWRGGLEQYITRCLVIKHRPQIVKKYLHHKALKPKESFCTKGCLFDNRFDASFFTCKKHPNRMPFPTKASNQR